MLTPEQINEISLHPKDKALQAFTEHKLVRILTTNNDLLEAGYIVIMYGEVAFRIQPKHVKHESQFIRLEEVKDVLFDAV